MTSPICVETYATMEGFRANKHHPKNYNLTLSALRTQMKLGIMPFNLPALNSQLSARTLFNCGQGKPYQAPRSTDPTSKSLHHSTHLVWAKGQA